jgi:hypothetical protein
MNDARLRRVEDKVDALSEKVTRAVTLMEASTAKEELRDHDTRIADLEGTRSTLIGWVAGSGLGGSAVGAFFMKMLGGH